MPPATLPTPAASTTNPSWLAVEAASSSLRSVWATATRPSSNAVLTPTQATTSCPHPEAASSGSTRSSR